MEKRTILLRLLLVLLFTGSPVQSAVPNHAKFAGIILEGAKRVKVPQGQDDFSPGVRSSFLAYMIEWADHGNTESAQLHLKYLHRHERLDLGEADIEHNRKVLSRTKWSVGLRSVGLTPQFTCSFVVAIASICVFVPVYMRPYLERRMRGSETVYVAKPSEATPPGVAIAVTPPPVVVPISFSPSQPPERSLKGYEGDVGSILTQEVIDLCEKLLPEVDQKYSSALARLQMTAKQTLIVVERQRDLDQRSLNALLTLSESISALSQFGDYAGGVPAVSEWADRLQDIKYEIGERTMVEVGRP